MLKTILLVSIAIRLYTYGEFIKIVIVNTHKTLKKLLSVLCVLTIMVLINSP